MIEIISLIANAFLGSGLIATLITLRSTARKAKTETYKSEIDLVTTSVTSMVDSQKTLMGHNQELINQLTESRRTNDHLSQRIDELEKKLKCIIDSNRQIVKLLTKLNVPEDVLAMLKKDE
jgi:hypothetical protein